MPLNGRDKLWYVHVLPASSHRSRVYACGLMVAVLSFDADIALDSFFSSAK